MDAEELRNFFNSSKSSKQETDTATILSVEGRLYPVDVYYLSEPCADYVQSIVDTALKIHNTEPPGDILAFLTGMEEVDRAVSLLKEHAQMIQANKRELYTTLDYDL